MFIILPLSHENMQAQRLPYITIGIVVINTILFILTHHFIIPKSLQAHYLQEEKLVQYYSAHLYLELPPETYEKLSPDNKQLLEYWKQINPGGEAFLKQNRNTDRVNKVLEDLQMDAEEMEEDGEEQLQKMMAEQQAELDELIVAFEASYSKNFYIKYGYIPSRGGFFTIFSSIFLHGGYLHLIFNMLFLWLSGCNIEDLWGRVVYPTFYLLGGIFATLAHGLMFPHSPVPLIGASGAIAAVMGAFLIRMYDTKIYFVYFFLVMGVRAGRFAAPAFIMLPLWLLQQLWEAMMHGGSSGVAFWAHIGGFVFGAIIALVMKFSGFEEKVLAPAIEKKVMLIDEHLASGIEKLQENDVDGAIQDLKIALHDNPDDVMAHSELSRAYFARGDAKLALREFKRAVFLNIKQGDIDAAVVQYLELSAELPDMMLDPPQQIKIAAAIEQRAATEAQNYSEQKEAKAKELEMYSQAALAYQKLIEYYQKSKKPLNHPNVIKALTHYGDLCLCYLEQPKNALGAYQLLLHVPGLEPEQKQKTQARIQQAKKLAAKQAKATKALATHKKAKTAQGKQPARKPPIQKPRINIPIPKRLKMVPEEDAPAKYQVTSVAPNVANKVLPYEDGLDLKRLSEPPVLFEKIYVICVFQLNEPTSSKSAHFSDSQEVIYADLFLAGESRPSRIASNNVVYSQFFQQVQQSSLNNFRQFILYLISHLYSVYVDQATLKFLKTGKPRIYDPAELKIHEKIFWKQLRGVVRAQCEHCDAIYWIDGKKIPQGGAKTTCQKCNKPMFVKPFDHKT